MIAITINVAPAILAGLYGDDRAAIPRCRSAAGTSSSISPMQPLYLAQIAAQHLRTLDTNVARFNECPQQVDRGNADDGHRPDRGRNAS
jgi:hypothetical protein